IAVLGLMAAAVVPASAERGGGGGGLGGTAKAAAFALDVDVDVLGALPLDVGPLARLRLSGDAGPRYANVAKVQVPPLLEALVLADMLALAARPNSRLSVPLIGDLILNEQKVEKTSSAHGNQVTVTVNALHLVLNGVLGKGDVTVAQSVCRASGKNVGKDL